jgi:photosystem II stability/assembly factor-like uncharacterized protein
MRRDDVERALDALASEVAAPHADAQSVVHRGRRRTRKRRFAVAVVVTTLAALIAAVGVVAHDDRSKNPALRTVEHEPHIVPGAGTYEVAAPSALEAWKCRNPIEYTNDGGRTWRATELAGAPHGELSCAAVAGGSAWAVWGAVHSGIWHLARIRNGGADVDIVDFHRVRGRYLSAPTFVDDDHGWISVVSTRAPLGRDLYRTTDGGKTWTLSATHQRLRSPSFVDANRGWSTDGRDVYASSDGGSTWQIVHQTSESFFEAVATPDGAVVWGGRLIQGGQYKDFVDVTTDGGRTWTRRSSAADVELPNGSNFLSAPDATHWQRSSGNALRVTSDAGRTWTTRPDMPAGINGPRMVTFPTAEVGWFTTDRGAVFRTTDGGRTWTNVTVGGEPAVTTTPQAVPIPLAFVSPTEGWLCSGPTMLYTTDAGEKWKNVAVPSHPPAPPRSQLPICTAVPGGDAWMLTSSADGNGLQVIHVSDGGGHVETSAFPPLRSDWTVRDLAFADRTRGWAFATDAAGGASTMLSTTDAGRTWEDDAPVRGVTVFARPDDGWAALELLPSELAHTTDGGRSWKRVRVDYGSAGMLRPIGVSGDTVVALAWSPTVSDIRPSFAVTEDGGGYWARRRAPRGLEAGVGQATADAIDADHWQIAAGNQLWTTDSGGRVWRHVAEFAGFSAITDVDFLTPDIGFVSATGTGAAADGTVVWRTADGGDTWSLVASHAPPFNSRTAPAVNFPGGIIGCPTHALTPPPAGNPPAGLLPAAAKYVETGPNGWHPTSVEAYPIDRNPPPGVGVVFRFQVASCGPATMANAWVVEMHGDAIDNRSYIPRAQLALSHAADGWHVFGRYH